MKNFKNALGVLSIALFLSIFSGAVIAAEPAKQLYDEYLKSYGEFKQAVERDLDKATIEKLSEKCKAALEKYKSAITGKEEAAKSASENPATANNGRAPEAEGINNGPAALADAIKQLHSSGAVLKIDEIIKKLEAVANNVSDPATAAKAKIELANAYSKYKNDHNRAVALLQDAVRSLRSGGDADGAKRALARAEFLKYKSQLEGVIKTNRAGAAELKKVYDSIKWTSPIAKIKALAAYNKALFDYRKAIATYKSYKEDGEKKENYTYYEYLTDLVGSRPALGVGDAFETLPAAFPETMARVRLLAGNNDAWYARWKAISEARQSIDMTYFIIKDDAFGKALYGLLMKKAREGVKVRLMIDDRGDVKSTVLPKGYDYLQELAEEKNIDVRLFNKLLTSAIPSIFRGIKNVPASNHQKIIVVDGKISITGGRNIAVEYLAAPEDKPHTLFRDTDVIIESEEIGNALRGAFEFEFDGVEVCKKVKPDLLGNWVSRERELLKSAESMDSWIKGRGLVQDKSLEEVNKELTGYKHMVNYASYEHFKNAELAPTRILSKSGYQQEVDEITDNVIAMMDASSDEIIIQNPYVVLTEKAKAAIIRASSRGVKVIVHTNSPESDNQIMSQAFFLDEDWKEFMKQAPNMRILVFTGKTTLHAKTFVFDHVISVIGTFNMDYLSEQINCENVCVVKSAAFAKENRDQIMADIAESKEYKIGIGADGKPYEIFGPDNFLSGKKKTIMDTLRKIKILRPLI